MKRQLTLSLIILIFKSICHNIYSTKINKWLIIGHVEYIKKLLYKKSIESILDKFGKIYNIFYLDNILISFYKFNYTHFVSGYVHFLIQLVNSKVSFNRFEPCLELKIKNRDRTLMTFKYFEILYNANFFHIIRVLCKMFTLNIFFCKISMIKLLSSNKINFNIILPLLRVFY